MNVYVSVYVHVYYAFRYAHLCMILSEYCTFLLYLYYEGSRVKMDNKFCAVNLFVLSTSFMNIFTFSVFALFILLNFS